MMMWRRGVVCVLLAMVVVVAVPAVAQADDGEVLDHPDFAELEELFDDGGMHLPHDDDVEEGEVLYDDALFAPTDVFAWGENDQGKLGVGGDERTRVPARVADTLTGVSVVKVVGGQFHSAALTEGGHVYTWGGGGGGQLGHFDTNNVDKPRFVEALENEVIVDIDAGWAHTIACTEDGAVYTWGFDKHYQLGHGEHATENAPRMVEKLYGKHVVKVAAGSQHSLALTADGDVWSWGHGGYGQLGHGSDEEDEETPRRVASLREDVIVDIAGGDRHSIALTEDGVVYVWGGGNAALNSGLENTLSPLEVVLPRDEVVLGIGSSVFVSFVITENHVYSFGWGFYGQLGHGDTKDQRIPRPIKQLYKKGVVEVTGGFGHSVAVDEDGNVWGWGGVVKDDDPWQWAQGVADADTTVPRIVPTDAAFAHVGAGFYHNIAVTMADEAGDE